MYKSAFFLVSALLAAAPAFAQMPDGSDINQAIPIYFGQVINDIIDGKSKPIQVYAIPLSRGQKVTVSADIKSGPSNPNWAICLYSPQSERSPKTAVQASWHRRDLALPRVWLLIRISRPPGHTMSPFLLAPWGTISAWWYPPREPRL
jgi:hypothetical protein